MDGVLKGKARAAVTGFIKIRILKTLFHFLFMVKRFRKGVTGEIEEAGGAEISLLFLFI